MIYCLRWSWCDNTRNKVHNKCNALELSQSHPHPYPPPPWENCLPWNQSLVPERLGTSGLNSRDVLSHRLKTGSLRSRCREAGSFWSCDEGSDSSPSSGSWWLAANLYVPWLVEASPDSAFILTFSPSVCIQTPLFFIKTAILSEDRPNDLTVTWLSVGTLFLNEFSHGYLMGGREGVGRIFTHHSGDTTSPLSPLSAFHSLPPSQPEPLLAVSYGPPYILQLHLGSQKVGLSHFLIPAPLFWVPWGQKGENVFTLGPATWPLGGDKKKNKLVASLTSCSKSS